MERSQQPRGPRPREPRYATPRPASHSAARAAVQRPSIIVKLDDAVRIQDWANFEAELETLQVLPWTQLRGQFDGVRLRRLYSSISPAQLEALVARAVVMDPDVPAAKLPVVFRRSTVRHCREFQSLVAHRCANFRACEFAHVTPQAPTCRSVSAQRHSARGSTDPRPTGLMHSMRGRSPAVMATTRRSSTSKRAGCWITTICSSPARRPFSTVSRHLGLHESRHRCRRRHLRPRRLYCLRRDRTESDSAHGQRRLRQPAASDRHHADPRRDHRGACRI